jgi:Ca2+-binding EF-hand superfamily protein
MVESTQVETGCVPYAKKVQYNFKPETISMIRQGFMSADSNKDSHIDIEEFGKMMKSFGHDELTEDKMKAVLAKFDTDNDGKISWLEYIDCYGECKGNFA